MPSRSRPRRRWLGAAIFALAASCDTGAGPNLGVSRVEVNLPSPTLLIGTNATAVARAFDLNGEQVTGVTPRWKTSAASIVVVDAAGEMLGVALGTVTITATIGGVRGDALLTVVPVPVASVEITPGSVPIERGQGLQFFATLRDQSGTILEGRPVAWVSNAPGIASVSGSGNVNAIAAGTALITASSENRSATVAVTVTVTPVPGGPSIGAIAPAVLLPGGTATLTGTGFGETAAQNEVRIAGVLTTIISASSTELVVEIPPGGYGCEPTREVFLQVVRGAVADAQAHPFQAVAQRTLEPGQSLVLSGATDAKCFELSATGGQYIISVYNASTAATSFTQAGFRLRGAFGLIPPGMATVVAPARDALRMPQRISVATPGEVARVIQHDARRREDEAHGRLLEANLEMLRREGPLVAARAAEPRPLRMASIGANQQVGSIVSLKVPNINSTGAGFCTDHFVVSGRIAYNGARTIIVEDVAAPLAGQIDALYDSLGEEFDALTFDMVRTNFADPLRLDGVLDQNGKVVMLFSPRVNTFGAVSGFVVSCDFLISPASSNRAEVFYARVPTVDGTDVLTTDTPAGWYRAVRSTVAHELKHIASFSNRIADFGSALDETWMEEGTARHSEEIWARTAAYNGLQQRANAGYAETVYCDLHPTGLPNAPQCVGAPLAMLRHLGNDGVYDFLRDNEQRSPLGPRPGFFADGSYYGSAWSLIRWAIDNHQVDEAAFLSALTRTNQTGVSNLTARLGRSWEEILGEWSLALYLDDLPGFVPVNSRLQMPSWNLRSIFAGMHGDFPATFLSPFPLTPRALTYGNFSQFVSRVAGGSYAMFLLGGTQTGRQLIQLRGTSTEEPNAALRMAIVRIN